MREPGPGTHPCDRANICGLGRKTPPKTTAPCLVKPIAGRLRRGPCARARCPTVQVESDELGKTRLYPLIALLLTACAQVDVQLDAPIADAASLEREAYFQQEAALDRLRQHDQRVANAAFRLSVAGADLCPGAMAAPGFVVHDAQQYGPATRAVAIRHYSLSAEPSVLVVAKGSPADQAGLAPNDQLLSVNGRSLIPPASVSTKASYQTLELAWSQIDRALAAGQAELDVRRGGAVAKVALKARAGCGYRVHLEVTDDLNAAANGREVFVTTALVRYAALDDHLAMIIAHEMAHNILKHQLLVAESGPAGALVGNPGVARSALQMMEREADYLGLYLVARAGYDLDAAGQFWPQLGADFPRNQYAGWTHPGALERSVNVKATIAEIRAKQKAGLPLVPDAANMGRESSGRP